MTDDDEAVTTERSVVERLAALALDPEVTTAEVARMVLDVDAAGLRTLLDDGALCGLQVHGRSYIDRASLAATATRLAENRVENTVATLEPLTAALAALLAERPVTDDYATARDTDAPLVLARRGRARVDVAGRYGVAALYGHDVALPASAVTRYLAATEHPPHPEVDVLPAGPALIENCLLLDGVSEQAHVTPAAPTDRRSRRVHRWLRLDTRTWTTRCPPELAAQLQKLASGTPDADADAS